MTAARSPDPSVRVPSTRVPGTHAATSDERVLRQEELGAGWWRIDVESPRRASIVRPGQFVQVRIGEGDDPLTRRPFSVYRTGPLGAATRTELSILYQAVGPGTRWMTRLRAGDPIDLLGPLGQPFPDLRVPPGGALFLVGGGIGVAPLYFHALELRHTTPDYPLEVLIGARSRALLVSLIDFEQAGLPVHCATDDGSAGRRGTVVALLEERLAHLPVSDVRGIGCGPHAMNRALRDAALARGLDFWISLDPVMPCGFGACYGCVIPSPGSPLRYRRVCVEGPAFPAQELTAAFPDAPGHP